MIGFDMNYGVRVGVGAVVEKNGYYLLVQEANEKYRGRWSLPIGHLEPNEAIIEAAKREVKEEAGCDVELTGICRIGNRVSEDERVVIVFTAELLHEGADFDADEIFDVRWFSYEEILAMRSEIRNEDLVISAIDNARNNFVVSIDIINQY